MDLSPKGLVELARSPSGKKLFRYAAVSCVGIVLTQIIFNGINFVTFHKANIGIFVADHHLRPWVGNVIAVSFTTIPTYYLNRMWVWGKRGKSHMAKEVLPFWAFSFAGLALSTLLVGLVSHGNHGKPTLTQQITYDVAQLAGFGVLWVVRFFVLDRLMFGKVHFPHDEIDEAAHDLLAGHADTH